MKRQDKNGNGKKISKFGTNIICSRLSQFPLDYNLSTWLQSYELHHRGGDKKKQNRNGSALPNLLIESLTKKKGKRTKFRTYNEI